MADETRLNIDGLQKILKALKANPPPSVKVGVLGDKESRDKSSATNSQIGAVHEYGSPARNIPQRSFLRVPLSDHLDSKLRASGAFEKKQMDDIIRLGTLKPWMDKVAVLAEGIVDEAFETSGYGKWPAWKDETYQNNSGDILVDTGQLRRSIGSEVIA